MTCKWKTVIHVRRFKVASWRCEVSHGGCPFPFFWCIFSNIVYKYFIRYGDTLLDAKIRYFNAPMSTDRIENEQRLLEIRRARQRWAWDVFAGFPWICKLALSRIAIVLLLYSKESPRNLIFLDSRMNLYLKYNIPIMHWWLHWFLYVN
jgi:hypothetical protein